MNRWRAALEWVEHARKDWNRSRIMLDHGDGGAAGMFLQQSLEKYIKGYLVAQDWPLRRTHELDRLLDAAAAHDPGLNEFRPLCERVSAYYALERYPAAGAGPDPAQVEADVAEARAMVLRTFPGEELP